MRVTSCAEIGVRCIISNWYQLRYTVIHSQSKIFHRTVKGNVKFINAYSPSDVCKIIWTFFADADVIVVSDPQGNRGNNQRVTRREKSSRSRTARCNEIYFARELSFRISHLRKFYNRLVATAVTSRRATVRLTCFLIRVKNLPRNSRTTTWHYFARWNVIVDEMRNRC